MCICVMRSGLSISYTVWVIIIATTAGGEQYSDYNAKIPDYGNYPSDYEGSPDHIYTVTPDYYDEKPVPRFHPPRPSLDYKDEEETEKQHYPPETKQNPVRKHRLSNRKSPVSFDYNSEDRDAIFKYRSSKFRPRNKERDIDNDEPKRHSSRYYRYNKKDASDDNPEGNLQGENKIYLNEENHSGHDKKTATDRVIRRKPRAREMKYGTKDDDGLYYTDTSLESFDDDTSPKPRTTLLVEGRRNKLLDAVLSDTARKRKYYKEYEDYYDMKRIQRLNQKLAAQEDANTFTPIEPMLSIRSSTVITANWLKRTSDFKRTDYAPDNYARKRVKNAEREDKFSLLMEEQPKHMEDHDDFDPKKPYHEVEPCNAKQTLKLSRFRNSKAQSQRKQNDKAPQFSPSNETEGMSDEEHSRIIDGEIEIERHRPHHLREERPDRIERNVLEKDRRNLDDTKTVINIGYSDYDDTDIITFRDKERTDSEPTNDEDRTKTTEALTKINTELEQNVSLSLKNIMVTRKITTKLSTTTISTTRQKTTEPTQVPNCITVEERSTMLSLDKTNLSIQKKARTKELIQLTMTKKPSVLMQMTNKSCTKIVTEPSNSGNVTRVHVVYDDVSPEQLLKIKRMMREKVLSNAKSVRRDLDDNWDEIVCDYIDMSLLDDRSSGIVGIANALLLFLSILFA